MMTPLNLTWPKSVYTHFFSEIQHCQRIACSFIVLYLGIYLPILVQFL